MSEMEKNKLAAKINNGIYAIGINDLNGNGNLQRKDNEIIYSKQLAAWEVLRIYSDKEVGTGDLYFTFDIRVLNGTLNGTNIVVCDEKVVLNPIDVSVYNSIGDEFVTVNNKVVLVETKKAGFSVQAGSSGALFEIKNIQFAKEKQTIYTDIYFSEYPQGILRNMAVKEDLLPYKALDYITGKYYYTFGLPHERRLPNQTISKKVLSKGKILNSSNSNVTKTLIDSEGIYYIVKDKHIEGSVLYQEYDKNDRLLAIVLCNESKAEGLVKFNKTTAYILSNFFWGNSLETTLFLEKTSIGTLYGNDCYPYDEVLKKGYLPNPGVGATCWGYRDIPQDLLDLSNVSSASAGVFYNRCGWYDVQKSEEDDCIEGFKQCFSETFERTVANKSRCRLGLFYTDFPGKAGGHRNVDGKDIYYMFPDYVFDKLYSSENYPLVILQYKDSPDIYNAIIDWRNTWVQDEYKKLLTKFSSWLDEGLDNGITRRKYVCAVEIRFWGKWGEGHNTDYYEVVKDNYVDSNSMIKIVDFYKEILNDIRLISPVGGYFEGQKDFFEYYFNAKNSVGYFGRFMDHIGSLSMAGAYYGGYSTPEALEYNKKILDTKNRAPMVGEIYQRTDDTMNMYLSYLIPGCISIGFSSVRYDNYIGFSEGVENSYNSYVYPSFKSIFRSIYNFIGAHIYFLVKYAYISEGKLKLWLLIGNIGNCIMYDNFWKLQIVTRLDDVEKDVFNIDLDLSTILPAKEVLVPHSYECESLKEEFALNSTEDELKIFIRIIDLNGISDNLFLSNVARTNNGEYEIYYSK